MTDSAYPCDCPPIRRRVGYQYLEVHTDDCRKQQRARNRRYRDALRGRYATRNNVFCTSLFEVEGIPDEPQDDGLDHVRPVVITPWPVSLAAYRLFETRIPAADHDLETDWRLLRWFWRQRELGLLDG